MIHPLFAKAIPFISALALSSFAQTVPAQSLSDRPIKLVVPYSPGGATDILARSLAESMSQQLKLPVIVDNRPGAAGNIGVDAVAKAPADGHTLSLALSSNLMINQFLFKKLPYNPQRISARWPRLPMRLLYWSSIRPPGLRMERNCGVGSRPTRESLLTVHGA